MKPDRAVDGNYLKALSELVSGVAEKTKTAPASALPIRMYIAGGAALHLMTGERVSEDVDASFSRRLLLSDDISAVYRDPDAQARLLYLDRNYNDTLGLLHEDAYQDSQPVRLAGVDGKRIDVRILAPLDLAVSKLARFSEQDRKDIELLARRRLIDAKALRKRAEEALGGYVGDLDSIRNTIDIACRLIESIRQRKTR